MLVGKKRTWSTLANVRFHEKIDGKDRISSTAAISIMSMNEEVLLDKIESLILPRKFLFYFVPLITWKVYFHYYLKVVLSLELVHSPNIL